MRQSLRTGPGARQPVDQPIDDHRPQIDDQAAAFEPNLDAVELVAVDNGAQLLAIGPSGGSHRSSNPAGQAMPAHHALIFASACDRLSARLQAGGPSGSGLAWTGIVSRALRASRSACAR
jgi:hypothetical protein